jgi:ABC-type glycerol-3-phosphate transport system substrate-binding protein
MIVASAGAACVGAPTTPATIGATPVATAKTTAMPIAGATLTPTRAALTRVALPITSTITLTLWTTEDLAPGTSAAGRVLKNQFDAFAAANPNIHIQTVLKKPYGKGGTLDFLITTHHVVPDQMPDLVALDLSEVPLAASAGIAQRLDGLLNAESKAELFPFALKAAHYQTKWIAVPFSADVEHFVYNKATLKKPPPTWDELIKQKPTLLAPLGGDSAFVTQYLALAPLFDQNNQLIWDDNSASQVFAWFKRARDLNLIAENAISLKNADDAWSSFAAGQAMMAQVSAARYFAERDKMPDAMYAPAPTRDGRAAGIGSGWAWVIVTTDPARQAAAARFIHWIVQPAYLAPWLRAARRLPADRTTLALATEPAEYTIFLRDQFERASYLPPTPGYAKAAEAWRAALAALWKGQMTPEEAARNVAAALK